MSGWAVAVGTPTLGVILFLGMWQLLAAGPLHSSNLPRVPETFDSLGHLLTQGAFWTSVRQTLTQGVVGFAVSVLIAVPLGLWVGMSPFGYYSTKVVIEVLKAIPAIVVLPLAVLQLGTSDRLSVFLVMFTLVPMLIGTVAAGVRDTDPVMLDAAKSFGLGRVARIRRIVIPSAVPFIATGLRVGAAFALVVAVVGGLYGGAPGLGRDLDTYRQAGALTTSFAYLVVLGVLGVGLNALLGAAERRVLFWHASTRRDAAAGGGRTVRERRTFAAGPRLWQLQDAVGARARRVEAAPAVRAMGRAVRVRQIPASQPAWRWALRGLMIAVPVGVVAIWWATSARSANPYFPPLSDTVHRFRDIWLRKDAVHDVVPSLRNLGIGFALGSCAGAIAGVVIGQVRWLLQLVSPLISFFRSIPSIAYLPVLIAVIGFSSTMRITAITLAAFFPVLIAAIDGVRGIDETVLEAARSYRIPRLVSLIAVRVPAALPRIFAGAELGLMAAIIVMVASELIGTSEGIGAQVLLAQQTFQFADMWAGLLLLAVIGIVSNVVLRVVRGWTLRWYDGAQAASRPR